MLLNTEKSIYAGITISISEQRGSTIAVAIRDATYLLDFIEKKYGPGEQQPCSEEAVEFVISQLRRYAEKHLEKVLGIAMHKQVAGLCPKLCSRLWAELDILPLVLPGLSLLGRFASNGRGQSRPWEMKDIDEQADSMARKCVRLVELFMRKEARVKEKARKLRLATFQAFWTRELSSIAGRKHGRGGSRHRLSRPSHKSG